MLRWTEEAKPGKVAKRKRNADVVINKSDHTKDITIRGSRATGKMVVPNQLLKMF